MATWTETQSGSIAGGEKSGSCGTSRRASIKRAYCALLRCAREEADELQFELLAALGGL